MRRTLLSAAAIVTLASVAAFAQEGAKPVPNTAGSYKIDPVHSFSMFRISHFNAGIVYGVVKGPTGSFEQDENGLKTVQVALDVDKIDTTNEARDKHLKGPDFFNAKQFPQMTFKSTSVTKGQGNAYEVKGDLTIKGNTKPVTVTLTKIGEGQGMQKELRAGYEVKFVVNRLEYGIDWNPGVVGNDVDVSVAFEGIKQ